MERSAHTQNPMLWADQTGLRDVHEYFLTKPKPQQQQETQIISLSLTARAKFHLNVSTDF